MVPRLDDMVLFAALAEQGSFTRASDATGVPLATLSRRIAALEGRLGAKLLQRTTRRMRLTDAGRDYLAYCRRIVAEAAAAEAAVAAKQAEPSGILRATAPPLVAEFLLAPALAAFAERFPKVHLELVLTDRRVALAEEGFDVALRVGAMADSGLVTRRLCRIGHSLYASPRYLRRHGAPQRMADLAGHRRLLFGLGVPMPWSRKPGWRPPPGPTPILVNGFVLLKAMTAAGQGLALLPDFMCRDETRRGSLQALPSPDWGFADEIQVVSQARRADSAKLAAFVDTLVALVGDSPAAGRR
ncbi:MAG: LysR family transcriptional regulator [Rhodospirillaceae bacterium]|nr:LysR family transcriptional regulator [Rhodospirillaceae bacterium]